MTDDIGGDAARFLSDGLELDLANDRRVRPRVRSPDDRAPWMATWADPEAGEVGLGPEVDDTRIVLYLSPAKAVFDDGERVWHYEWLGGLYCEREHAAFDFEADECPHCGDTLDGE